MPDTWASKSLSPSVEPRSGKFISDPGSRGQKSIGSQIQNTGLKKHIPQATYSYLAYEDVSVLSVPYCARIFKMTSPETAEERLVGGMGNTDLWGISAAKASRNHLSE
jgi:hypothetical protein